jgi:hypothetical protein
LVDHKDKGDGLVDKTNDIDKDLDQRIKDLKDLIKENLKKGKEIL